MKRVFFNAALAATFACVSFSSGLHAAAYNQDSYTTAFPGRPATAAEAEELTSDLATRGYSPEIDGLTQVWRVVVQCWDSSGAGGAPDICDIASTDARGFEQHAYDAAYGGTWLQVGLRLYTFACTAPLFAPASDATCRFAPGKPGHADLAMDFVKALRSVGYAGAPGGAAPTFTWDLDMPCPDSELPESCSGLAIDGQTPSGIPFFANSIWQQPGVLAYELKCRLVATVASCSVTAQAAP